MVRPTASNRLRRSAQATRKHSSNANYNFCPKYSADDLKFRVPTLPEENSQTKLLVAGERAGYIQSEIKITERSLNGAIAAQDVETVLEILKNVDTSRQVELNYGLSMAITGRSLTLVDILLKAGADIHTNDQFYPLIMTAVDLGMADTFTRMMDHSRKKATEFSSQYGTLLHASVRAKSLDIVKLLIERGLGINDKNEAQGATALILAVRFVKVIYATDDEANCESRKRNIGDGCEGTVNDAGKIAIVRRHDPNCKCQNVNVEMPSPQCEKEIIEYLLQNGADVDAIDNTGKTALHYAATMGYDDIIQLLVEHNASLSIIDKEGNTAWIYAIKFKSNRSLKSESMLCPKDLNTKYDGGKTLMHQCCAISNAFAVGILLNNGADVDVIDDHGNTCLMSACSHYDSHSKLDVIELLLAKAKHLAAVENHIGDTPFYILCCHAIANSNLTEADKVFQTLKELLDCDVDINKVHSMHNETALMSCLANKSMRNWQLYQGANLNLATKTKTVLGQIVLCATQGSISLDDINDLLHHNIDMTMGNISHAGVVPAQTLFEHQDEELIELFLDAGLNVSGLRDWLKTSTATELRRGNNDIDKLMKRAEYEIAQPIGLQSLGRQAALNTLGHCEVSNKIQTLGLPKLLEDFLDIDIFMCCRRNDATIL